jgi:UPF0755 protein
MTMRKIYHLFKLLLLLFFVALGAVAYDVWRVMHEPMTITQSESYEFGMGAPAGKLARDFQQRGWLARPLYWSLWLRVTGEAGKLKAGEYMLEPGLTPAGLINLMVEGKVKQYSITLVEGRTFYQMLDTIHESPHILHTLKGMDAPAIMQRIGYPGQHPEGMFFPDTYTFPKGMDDVGILRRAYEAMQTRLNQVWETRDANLPFKSPYEALIMASIVEKESANKSERKQIAGLFINRLRIGMRLQTDPTVIYGLGQSFDGNLRRRDLQSDTPYNSYTRKGLPPTPIAMPGQEAIEAVMHPDTTPYLFFVAKGNGSGTHVFSTTLAEHEAAVDKYQRKKKKK